MSLVLLFAVVLVSLRHLFFVMTVADGLPVALHQ